MNTPHRVIPLLVLLSGTLAAQSLQDREPGGNALNTRAPRHREGFVFHQDPRIHQRQLVIALWQDGLAAVKWQYELDTRQQKNVIAMWEGLDSYYKMHAELLMEERRAVLRRAEKLHIEFQALARGRAQIALPQTGFIARPRLEADIENAKAGVRQVERLHSEGNLQGNLAGFGSLSRNSLNTRIETERQRLQNAMASATSGNWTAVLTIVGAVNHNAAQTVFEQQQQAIDGLKARMAAGTLGPPGPFDRAALQAQIANARGQLAAVRQQAEQGNHPGATRRLGALTLAQTDAAIAARKGQIQRLTEQIRGGVVPVSINTVVGLSRVGIEAEIRGFKNQMKRIKDSFSARTYRAWSRSNESLDMRTIYAQLEANPGRERAELLSGSLPDIRRAYSLDAALWSALAKERRQWLGWYEKLCQPSLIQLENELAFFEQHRKSIDLQVGIATRFWQRQIGYLEKCLKLAPQPAPAN